MTMRVLPTWTDTVDAPARELGDDAVAREIFALVYRQMRAIASSRRGDFDDLVQIAIERVLRGLPSFQGRSELSTWTYRICYLTLVSHERTLARFFKRFVFQESVPERPDPNELAVESLERRERVRRLRDALDRVSPKRRVVVVLHDLEGLDIDAITKIVGAKRNTVKSRLRDGHRQLARLLADDPYFGDVACRRRNA